MKKIFVFMMLLLMAVARPPTMAANPFPTSEKTVQVITVTETGSTWPPEVQYTPSQMVATPPRDETFYLVSTIQQLKESNLSPSGGLAR